MKNNEYIYYELYLEGIARELMHIIQQRRKELKLNLMDFVDIAIVEENNSKLTSSIYHFVDRLIEHCRIKKFSPNPIKSGCVWEENIEDYFKKSHKFKLYIERVS